MTTVLLVGVYGLTRRATLPLIGFRKLHPSDVATFECVEGTAAKLSPLRYVITCAYLMRQHSAKIYVIVATLNVTYTS